MNQCYIYKIICTANGKFYIGGSKNYRNRFTDHIRELRKNIHINYLMQKYYNEFGRDAFKLEKIKRCEPANLRIWEKYYIKTLKPDLNCYVFDKNGINKKSKRRKVL